MHVCGVCVFVCAYNFTQYFIFKAFLKALLHMILWFNVMDVVNM